MAPPCGSGRRWTRAVKMIMCLFFVIPMSSTGIRNTNVIFDKKQKLEIQQQLKDLNKPALKTIESPDGDLIDCVDIKNQPAFDHPLMKNHTIQMRPSSYPKGFLFDESNNVSSNSKPAIAQLWHLNGRCPEGTIPIRRIKEEELLRASSIENYRRKKNNAIIDYNNNRHEYVTITEVQEAYFGMNAEMNVWNPQVQDRSEFSLAQFWILGANNDGIAHDTIEAGMMVFYEKFRDYNTRLFTFWTNNAYETGYYNLERNLDGNGFVQLDNRVALGASIMPISEYGGVQTSLNFFVYKDNVEGHWWLQLSNRYLLGYWPSFLFEFLSHAGSAVSWGGEVINNRIGGRHTTTQMGSGHFAEEGPTRASFFRNLKVMVVQQNLRAPGDTQEKVTNPNCYNLLKEADFFYYGGPGRNPNCP